MMYMPFIEDASMQGVVKFGECRRCNNFSVYIFGSWFLNISVCLGGFGTFHVSRQGMTQFVCVVFVPTLSGCSLL